MASTSTLLQVLFHTNPLPLSLLPSPNPSPSHFRPKFSIKCNSTPTPEPVDPSFPIPSSETTISPESFPIEKRRRSEIIQDPKSRTGLTMPEPPSFEIGWKRTKEIKLEKPKGYVIADFLEKLEGLMGKEFGSTELLAKAGEIVAERAREEAVVLREKGEVEERLITELFRVLRLIEMDMTMVKAAVKEETLNVRLEQAKARCRQAILVALSF
ncbi:protein CHLORORESPIRATORY REDUCTION 41, chloroplastic [Humulus lupulus]|uniref:protein CHLORORESPIRATORY REDUCTION 41, chloroplastic n=1 Tax=Humulus lupulus TaxID=3486 RepID=UPI002B413187|nr:protein CHLORORESPIRATORY REDUCTION 41, chloroplastic [Humulus lupulus]